MILYVTLHHDKQDKVSYQASLDNPRLRSLLHIVLSSIASTHSYLKLTYLPHIFTLSNSSSPSMITCWNHSGNSFHFLARSISYFAAIFLITACPYAESLHGKIHLFSELSGSNSLSKSACKTSPIPWQWSQAPSWRFGEKFWGMSSG